MADSLPYPHARNDCEMCRERDADFHVLGEEFNKPDHRQLLLCRRCLGEWAITRVWFGSGSDDVDQPVAITIKRSPYWLDRIRGAGWVHLGINEGHYCGNDDTEKAAPQEGGQADG
jgi:hypothetical protein